LLDCLYWNQTAALRIDARLSDVICSNKRSFLERQFYFQPIRAFWKLFKLKNSKIFVKHCGVFVVKLIKFKKETIKHKSIIHNMHTSAVCVSILYFSRYDGKLANKN